MPAVPSMTADHRDRLRRYVVIGAMRVGSAASKGPDGID
jgi:hypothetical protein